MCELFFKYMAMFTSKVQYKIFGHVAKSCTTKMLVRFDHLPTNSYPGEPLNILCTTYSNAWEN